MDGLEEPATAVGGTNVEARVRGPWIPEPGSVQGVEGIESASPTLDIPSTTSALLDGKDEEGLQRQDRDRLQRRDARASTRVL